MVSKECSFLEIHLKLCHARNQEIDTITFLKNLSIVKP